ncbi:hypothetical protein ACV56Z_10845 [Staphylococcus aureus]
MSNIAFYVVSDVRGSIFPTSTGRNQYRPMGLLLANHVINKTEGSMTKVLK